MATATAPDVAPRVEPAPRRRRIPWDHAPIAALVAVVAVVAVLNHFKGVDWGDDFALYLRQAKAIANGNIGEVIADNRFAVDNSGWRDFSPYVYPWGWPLLMAPIVAVKGLAYGTIKLLEVAALGGFLLAFYALLRRRTGTPAALVLVALIGLSPMYIGATDTVLSDIPYLGVTGITLWWIDRCRRVGLLEAVSRRDLVLLGLAMAFAYNIRREGVALVVALLATHAAVIVTRRRPRAWWSPHARFGDVEWKRVALPYGTFAAAVAGFQLLLPSVVLTRYAGTGPRQIAGHLTYYRDALAEQVGLKDPGRVLSAFGSALLADRIVKLIVVLAVIGVITRLATRPREDIALVAYGVAAAYVVGIAPFQDARYLFTITPLIVYFAYQAPPTVAWLLTARGTRAVTGAAVAAGLAVGALLASNLYDVERNTRFHLDYPQYAVNGPDLPASKEMFAAVRDKTRADDVILFFRARAMTLYTDRRAVQGSSLDQMLPRVDWYAMEKGSTYSQTLLTDAEAAGLGLTKEWENQGWVLWKVPRER